MLSRTLVLLTLGTVTALSSYAQVCNPATVPTGLTSTYTPGTGVLLEWDAVPGSIGVQLRVDLPSGSTINKRVVSFERDQFFVPDAVLTDGSYTWRVQAACSTIPPYDVTPISAPNIFIVSSPGSCPATVTDIDGNVYPTVQIGSQCWTAENLKVERLNNGDALATGLNNLEWGACCGLPYPPPPAYAWKDNNAATKATYGLLYNWFAVTDFRGLCPIGWHVPSDAEWIEMITVLDPSTCSTCVGAVSTTAGGALKATGTLSAGTGLWLTPNTGATNSSGFGALPGGWRGSDGSFGGGVNSAGYYWSTSEWTPNPFNAINFFLSHSTDDANRLPYEKTWGYSVRCLKD